MNILQEIKNSLYNPAYYRSLFHKPLSLSLRYFVSLVLLLSFVATVFLSLIFVPHVYRFAITLGQELYGLYPSNMVITIKNGQAESNIREPFNIPYPERLRAALEAGKQDTPQNFVTISTKDKASVESLEEHNTLVLVAGDAIVTPSENAKEVALHPYAATSSLIVNKTEAKKLYDAIVPMLKLIPPILVLLIFIFFVLVLMVNLLYLLIGALVVMLVARSLNYDISYGKAYQLGLHAITASIFLDLVLLMVPGGLSVGTTLVLMMVVLAAVVYLNLRQAVENHF